MSETLDTLLDSLANDELEELYHAVWAKLTDRGVLFDSLGEND